MNPHGGGADRHGCAKGKDGEGDDEAHNAAHADGQGIHVAVSDDEGIKATDHKSGVEHKEHQKEQK